MKKNKWVNEKTMSFWRWKIFLIMKLLTVFIFGFLLQSYAVVTKAQDMRVNLRFENNTLKEVLQKLEDETEFSFIYKDEQISSAKLITENFKNEKVTELLDQVLKKENLSYVIKGRVIVILPDNSEAISIQQQKSISGKVIDSSGQPLPGVTILLKGTSQGTITDFDGNFKINRIGDNDILVFKFVGMKSQEVPVKNRSSIDIILKEESIGIDEVVAVGYGIQKKLNVTGSVSAVKGKSLVDIPVANTSNGLVGKLPGLIAVNRSGEPGSDASSLSIRGFDNMLTIVDGIEQSFNQIDPSEIESISILKDASASIYGARAGNGVILVKTKRGASGKPIISFNSFWGMQTPTRVPKLVDAPTYAKMYNDGEIASGKPALFSDAEIQKYKDGSDPKYPNINQYDVLFRKWAPISQYNLNSSGGGDKVTYFFSFGYMDQEGMPKSGISKYQRYNIRSNVDAQITKSLKVSLDLSGIYDEKNSPSATYDADGSSLAIMEQLQNSTPIAYQYWPDATKPVGLVYNQLQKDRSGYRDLFRKYLTGILTAQYDFQSIKGLSAKGVFNYRTDYQYQKSFRLDYPTYNYNWDTKEYILTKPLNTDAISLSERFDRNDAMTTQFFLTYNREIKEHNFGAMVVAEYIKNNGNYFSASKLGFTSTAIDQLFAGNNTNMLNDGSASQNGRIGYASRFNYSYAGKYLAEATFRYDGSDRFISDKRWGFFPGLSLGWRLSSEPFLKGVKSLDNLKLRLSYGQAGNDYGVNPYNYLTGYNFSSGYVFGLNPAVSKGIISKGLANVNLLWEKTATSNAGFDASFWNGLLSVEFDAFYRKVTNVIGKASLSLPTTFGAELPSENINSYSDRGFELTLGHTNTIGKLKYTISGNVSWARSKWIHYDEPVFADTESRNRLQLSGNWKNRMFGYHALGLFQSQEEITNYKVIQDNNGNTTLKPGDIKYDDFNKDGVIDWKDEHVIGRGNVPEIISGLNMNFEYEGFDLSLQFQGATNFNVMLTGNARSAFSSQRGQTPFDYLQDYWTPENKDAKYPRLVPGGAANNNYTSDYWLLNSTYLRLKNVQIGYTIPKKWLTKLKFETARLFVSGYNVFTIDNVYPFDPESVGSVFYPQQKSYNLGVKLTF